MDRQRDYEQLYNDLSAGLDQIHKANLEKTKTALRSLFIIPTIFLILIFLTNSSKSTFLTLWLISFFVIACVLIVIEYQDYKLRTLIADVEAAAYESEEDENEEDEDGQSEELSSDGTDKSDITV